MSFVLRRISKRDNWFKDPREYPWLGIDEVLGDILSDFLTKDGSLSVYEINDDKSDIKRVATALAATRDDIDTFAYILVRKTSLIKANFKLQITQGDTADDVVNRQHLSIQELSTKKVALLAEIIWKEKDEDSLDSFDKQDMQTMMLEEVMAQHLSLDRIKSKKIREKIQNNL